MQQQVFSLHSNFFSKLLISQSWWRFWNRANVFTNCLKLIWSKDSVLFLRNICHAIVSHTITSTTVPQYQRTTKNIHEYQKSRLRNDTVPCFVGFTIRKIEFTKFWLIVKASLKICQTKCILSVSTVLHVAKMAARYWSQDDQLMTNIYEQKNSVGTMHHYNHW